MIKLLLVKDQEILASIRYDYVADFERFTTWLAFFRCRDSFLVVRLLGMTLTANI